MKTERWCFTASELEHPESCKSDDEFVGMLPAGNEYDYNILVDRTGTPTDRWEDGCVGVPDEVKDLVKDEDTFYTRDGEECADIWRDVLVNDDSSFYSFARAVRENSRKSKAPRQQIRDTIAVILAVLYGLAYLYVCLRSSGW